MSIKYVTKIKLYQEARKKDILGKDHYTIKDPSDINALGRHFLRGDVRESMLAVALNTKNEVIAVYSAFTGTINAMMVSPREIMQFALLNNANALVLIHNHPSGNARPSQEDIDFSRRMSMAGELVKINVLDHVIVTDDDYTSIRSIDETIFDPTGDAELTEFVADEAGAGK